MYVLALYLPHLRTAHSKTPSNIPSQSLAKKGKKRQKRNELTYLLLTTTAFLFILQCLQIFTSNHHNRRTSRYPCAAAAQGVQSYTGHLSWPSPSPTPGSVLPRVCFRLTDYWVVPRAVAAFPSSRIGVNRAAVQLRGGRFETLRSMADRAARLYTAFLIV